MAEERVIAQAANEVVEEVTKTTNRFGGKMMLIAGGICIGFGTGYFFAKKQLETKYQQMAETEIKEMREHYLAKEKEREAKKPALDEVMEAHGYKTKLEGPDETLYVKIDPDSSKGPVSEVVEGEVVEGEVVDVWDYTTELQGRSEDVPYVIHRDEFFGNETPFEQVQLTYYEGDDVLADSNDTPVDDQDAMVGLGNLSKFGHGSQDPNVVYIRNHELQLEIEVVHDDGNFIDQTHGFSDDELQHGNRRRRKRRRFDDE